MAKEIEMKEMEKEIKFNFQTPFGLKGNKGRKKNEKENIFYCVRLREHKKRGRGELKSDS